MTDQNQTGSTLKKLEWDLEKYGTGFNDIDVQHRRLFYFINQLGEDIEAGKAQETIGDHLNFMATYIKNHFGMEEDCMAANRCPFYEKNCDAHNKFIKAYEDYKAKLTAGTDNAQLLREIHKMMVDWTVNHICNVDRHLKDCYSHHEFDVEDERV